MEITREEVEKELKEGEKITIQPSRMCQNGHFFTQTKSREVKCSKCPVGYELSIGMTVREGHIYLNGELVI